jgi:hypothetical protein
MIVVSIKCQLKIETMGMTIPSKECATTMYDGKAY